MAKSTMKELVEELARLEPRTREIQAMIDLACAGEYHDFKNKLFVCGKLAAIEHLGQAAARHPVPTVAERLLELRRQVKGGEFDEEMDEEDRAFMAKEVAAMTLGRGITGESLQ